MAGPPIVGMVERLDSSGAGPTEAEVAFVKAYLADGPMDPAMLARLADPNLMAEREARTAALRARDWPNLSQYRVANAAAATPAKAVFIGDSLTEFWAAAEPDFFTGGVVGRGVSGQTSPQILLRFMADVVALRPGCVHILCGANDVAGNTGPNLFEDYTNNVTAMISLARAHGVGVILGNMPRFNSFSWAPGIDPVPWVVRINEWLARAAAAQGLVLADYASALEGGTDRLAPELTRDGVHPTMSGYRVMRPVAEAALARALGEPAPGAGGPE